MKIEVTNSFEKAMKRFMRAVREHQIITDVVAKTAFRSKGEERRIKRRRAIKRRVKADAKLRELDTLTKAPMTYVEKSQAQLRRTQSAAGNRDE